MVLFGVVKKNSILQIDHINQLRAEGMRGSTPSSRKPRPSAPDLDDDAGVRGRHAAAASRRRASAPGSTAPPPARSSAARSCRCLLTLLATPVAYSLFDDLATAGKLKGAAAEARAPTPRPAPTRSCPKTRAGSLTHATGTAHRDRYPHRERGVHTGRAAQVAAAWRSPSGVPALGARPGGPRPTPPRGLTMKEALAMAKRANRTWSSSARGWPQPTPTSSRPGRRCFRS